MPSTSRQTAVEVDVIEVEQETAIYHILGTSPVILNRLSEKARRELLMPAGRKNAAERATTLKHNPLEEFRASAYTMPAGSPTHLGMMATAFKGAMRTAALDIPGTNKAQIGRLVYVEGDMVALYGIPELMMSITRSADMNHTPDVRSRAVLREWACELRIRCTVPLIKVQMATRLLAAAGMICGVGDWRNEKGSGSYGAFTICAADNPDYLRIIATGGREAQIEALASPSCYDSETEELLTWFDDELSARRIRGVA